MAKLYIKLQTPINGMDELKIYTDYDKGSFNYFSGETNRRGLYVHINPVSRSEYSERTMLLSDRKSCGFKVFMIPLGRRSDKKEYELFKKIEPIAQELARLYEKEKYDEIYDKLMAA